MAVLAQAPFSQPGYLLIDELPLGLAPVVVSRLIPVIAAVPSRAPGVLLIDRPVDMTARITSRKVLHGMISEYRRAG